MPILVYFFAAYNHVSNSVSKKSMVQNKDIVLIKSTFKKMKKD